MHTSRNRSCRLLQPGPLEPSTRYQALTPSPLCNKRLLARGRLRTGKEHVVGRSARPKGEMSRRSAAYRAVQAGLDLGVNRKELQILKTRLVPGRSREC